MEQLAPFQYSIIHRPGKLHQNANVLSRRPSEALTNERDVQQVVLQPLEEEGIDWCVKKEQEIDSDIRQLAVEV